MVKPTPQFDLTLSMIGDTDGTPEMAYDQVDAIQDWFKKAIKSVGPLPAGLSLQSCRVQVIQESGDDDSEPEVLRDLIW